MVHNEQNQNHPLSNRPGISPIKPHGADRNKKKTRRKIQALTKQTTFKKESNRD